MRPPYSRYYYNILLLFIHCLTSDSDPFGPTQTVSYIYIGRKLYKKTPYSISLPLSPAYVAPISRLRVAYSRLYPNFQPP